MGTLIPYCFATLKIVTNLMSSRYQLAIGKETGRRLGMGTNMYPSSALLS